jgi:copper chaperone CopZ
MTTTTYSVEGLTCGHCVSAVTAELGALPQVTDVAVDLRVGAASAVTVTSTEPVADADVAAAIDEAGDYRLAAS